MSPTHKRSRRSAVPGPRQSREAAAARRGRAHAAASGLTVIAIRRAAVPLVEVRLRVPAVRRGADLRPRRAAGAHAALRHRHACPASTSPPSCSASAAGCPPGRTRTGCSSPATRWPRAGRRCWSSWPRCSPTPTYPRGGGRRRARPAGRPDPGARRASPPSWPTALLKRMYGGTRTVADPRAGAGPGGARRRSCAPCTPPGPPGRRLLVLVGDLDPEQAHRPRPKGAGQLDRPRTGRRRCRTPGAWSPGRCCWSTGPARCSRRCGWRCRRRPRTHPDHAAAAAGQPGLRRLLLVPLGGEHPRGQGLHVRPAHLDRALRRRLRAGRRRRGGHRGDRAGAAGDLYELGRIAGAAAERRPSWTTPCSSSGTLALGIATQSGLA